MITCINKQHSIVIATNSVLCYSVDNICNICHTPVVFHEANDNEKAKFEHQIENTTCKLSVHTNSLRTGKYFYKIKKEMKKENNLCWYNGFKQIETNLGNTIVLQDSKINTGHFQEKNNSINTNKIWIFDASNVDIFEYHDFLYEQEKIYFCVDEFDGTYDTKSGDTCILFHCADGKLRQTCCDASVQIQLANGRKLYVRILIAVNATNSKNVYTSFGKRCTEVINFGKDIGKIELISSAITVLSVEGRTVIDKVHRDAFLKCPSTKLTIYNAPPGAGKTTALKKSVREWTNGYNNKKVLVIVFNKSNQELLQKEMKDCSKCVVQTLDSLCASAFPPQDEDNDTFDPISNDRSIVKNHFVNWNIQEKLTRGGARGSAGIIQHRLTHPKAKSTICFKHQKLSLTSNSDSHTPAWDASFSTFPIISLIKSVSTFASRRFICDRDTKLVRILSKYDIILVDEMQDLCSAQEMRLIRQASCPIVMVGDFNQTINAFRHRVHTDSCHSKACVLPAELPPNDLPNVIEWYSTFRLDSLTVMWLEDLTGKRMCSNRTAENLDSAVIIWSTEIKNDYTFVICRCNESVIKIARNYAGMQVVNGNNISSRLTAASLDKNQRSPISQYARHLQSKGVLHDTIQMLQDRHISLQEVVNGGISAVGTVHQVKGFEYDHVAVHEDILQHAEQEIKKTPSIYDERNCLFVALSRHRKSITILKNLSNYSQVNSNKVFLPNTSCFDFDKNDILE